MHLVGHGEEQGRPFLVGDEGGRVVRLPLQGDFSWTVEGPRTCVGLWREGRHRPCPDAAPVGGDATCVACGGGEDPCIFEPLCAAGGACRCSFGAMPHVVYAAFFGTLPKVGLTQAWRLATRLREQGADAYFPIAAVGGRGEARNLERAISYLHGVPEYRTSREVLPLLARPVPWDLVASRARQLAERLELRHGKPGALVAVTDHPVRQPLPGVPARRVPDGRHEGTWLGSKGPHLFYARRHSPLEIGKSPVAALKRADLLGRFVTPA